jgi:hypothetical protein
MESNKDEETIGVADLQQSINGLEERIDKVNSFKNIFFKGIVTGLGSVIGATIIFAVFISLLSWFISTTEIAWVNKTIETLGLSEMFNK